MFEKNQESLSPKHNITDEMGKHRKEPRSNHAYQN